MAGLDPASIRTVPECVRMVPAWRLTMDARVEPRMTAEFAASPPGPRPATKRNVRRPNPSFVRKISRLRVSLWNGRPAH